jgi:GNAT superfamily N-acetyltransferase
VTITISRADIKEARALTALRTAVARDMTERFGGGPWSALPNRMVVIRQMRASHVLVARRYDEIIGTVRLAFANTAVFDARMFTPVDTALYVLGLAVSPGSRGRGIGSRIMSVAKEVARSWPAQALWLATYDNSAGAGRFYRKCGFREVGPGVFDDLPLTYYEWTDSA